ncbi:MAG: single-stranded DNA-binding protein [Trueperaceae bacterium]
MNQTHHLGCVINPQLAYTPAKLAVLEFTLGIRETSEHTHTSYVTCKLFGKYAETLEPHLKEGCVVETFGALHQVNYESKAGTKQTDTTITVNDLLLLEGTFEFWQDRKNQRLLVNGLNEVCVTGNLTKDTQITNTKTGHVSRTRVAVKDADSTLFIDVTFWDALELNKGQAVVIAGRLLSDSYKNDTKKTVYVTLLEATRVHRFAKLH